MTYEICALANPSPDVHKAAEDALRQFGLSAVKPLCAALPELEPEAQARVCALLGDLGMDDEQAFQSLITMASIPGEARRAALKALTTVAGTRAFPVLVRALDDPDYAVRAFVTDLLGEIPSPDVFERLSTLAVDRGSSQVRTAACRALGRLGYPAALPFLLRALGDSDPMTRSAAFVSALAFGNAGIELLLETAQHHNDSRLRAAALPVANYIDSTRATALLEASLASPHMRVVAQAAALLGSRRDPLAVKPLIETLGKHPDVEVVEAVAHALGLIGDTRAVEPLLELVKGGIGRAACAAAKALGDIGDVRAVEPLAKLLPSAAISQSPQPEPSAKDPHKQDESVPSRPEATPDVLILEDDEEEGLPTYELHYRQNSLDFENSKLAKPRSGAEFLTEVQVEAARALARIGGLDARAALDNGGPLVSEALAATDSSQSDLPWDREATHSREIVVTGHSPSGERVTWFEPETAYALRFRVAAPSDANLARGKVDVAGVPETGLAARWIVTSTNVEFLAIPPAITIVKHGDTWLAEFDLAIPVQGDSATVTLNVRTTKVGGELTLTLLVSGEEYRKLTVNLGFGACVKEDVVCTVPSHLNLDTTHEWTTPPEHIAVHVCGQTAVVTTIRGTKDYGMFNWMGNSATLKNPIQRVRNALEKFRIVAEAHLNNFEVADMDQRLYAGQWKPYDWNNHSHEADASHDQSLTAFINGVELHALARDGYRLFDTCFPQGSDLRRIIEKLEPGSRLDFVWTERGAVDWVSHVPWALMYLDSLKSSEPVNCERFLGLRYRIGSTSWEPKAPSRALGDPGQVNSLNFLYWGSDPKDEVGTESLWQRKEFGKWARQYFVPDPNSNDPKQQVISALEMPQPDPACIFYFYCQCSVKDGSDPVLQFGETSKTADIVEASDMYTGRLEAGPLIFANACTTVAADPQGTSELESCFFARGIRAFLGTETKVPTVLASHFAWLFFQFFLRNVDPSPMAAGEALAQARLFMWTQYRNPGGLFYCLVNSYDLFLASDAEVAQLQRK